MLESQSPEAKTLRTQNSYIMKVYNLDIKNKVRNRNVFANLEEEGIDTTSTDAVYKWVKKGKAIFKLKNNELHRGELLVNDNFEVYDNVWFDILPTNIGSFIYSEKIKSIIDKNLTGFENLIWLRIGVKYQNELRPYYLISFTKELDTLDLKLTIFDEQEKGAIIIPFFSKKKIVKLNAFYSPFWEYYLPISVCFSEHIVRKLKKEKLPNIRYEEITRVSE